VPRNIVDLSARSQIIRQEPWNLHFWECTVQEYLEFLKNPREFLSEMGIKVPEDCSIETSIENHDWIGANTNGFARDSADDDGPIIICNVGGGDVALTAYRIVSYGHVHSEIGRYEKELLHSADRETRD
jgi:hypothetical protein